MSSRGSGPNNKDNLPSSLNDGLNSLSASIRGPGRLAPPGQIYSLTVQPFPHPDAVMFQRPTLRPGQAINLLQWTRCPGPSGPRPPLLIVGARLGEA